MPKLVVVAEDDIIIYNNEAIKVSHTDLSWIPSDVWAVNWDTDTNKGWIEYRQEPGAVPTKGNENITDLGIYAQAITDHASEKTAQADALEASRNHALEVKHYRKMMLQDSDWTQVPDSPLSSSKKTEWATYRQQLRDLPATVAADSNLTDKALADDLTHSGWPTKPS